MTQSHTWYEWEEWRGVVKYTVEGEQPPNIFLPDNDRILNFAHNPMSLDDMLAPELAAVPGQPLDIVWDLSRARTSFDAISWLINADVYAQLHGFSRIRVRFDGKQDDFCRNVAIPAIGLFPNMTEGHDSATPTQFISTMPRFGTEMYRRKGILSRIRSPNPVASAEPFVTITLREFHGMPERNSNVAAWVEFAKTLRQKVIFIRDTAKADEPIEGFETAPLASRNLHHRMALYEAASMNYFVSNGPITLVLWTNHIPYLCIMKSPPYYALHHEPHMFYYVGIHRDEQMPMKGDRQFIAWSEDSLPEIAAAAAHVDTRSPAYA